MILRQFTDVQRSMSLGEIVERTGLERTIVFRLLRTLEEEGFLRRPEGRGYISNVSILTQKRFRIGYACARIFCEFYREPDTQFIGPVSMGMALSIPVWLGAAILFSVALKPKK